MVWQRIKAAGTLCFFIVLTALGVAAALWGLEISAGLEPYFKRETRLLAAGRSAAQNWYALLEAPYGLVLRPQDVRDIRFNAALASAQHGDTEAAKKELLGLVAVGKKHAGSLHVAQDLYQLGVINLRQAFSQYSLELLHEAELLFQETLRENPAHRGAKKNLELIERMKNQQGAAGERPGFVGGWRRPSQGSVGWGY